MSGATSPGAASSPHGSAASPHASFAERVASGSRGPSPTVEWQVAGACNYDCSYCIQSRIYRRGRPSDAQLRGTLATLAALAGVWEVKCSGGEAFAHPPFLSLVVPGLMDATPHRISVLTNFSASRGDLMRFTARTRGRLAVFSASLHTEHVDPIEFADKARWFVDGLDPEVAFVVNQVVLPDRLDAARAVRDSLAERGIRWFPQLLKVGGRVTDYPDEAALRSLIGDAPGPREANLAPSYFGRACWAGSKYFAIDKDGGAWACRTSKRHGEGALGDAFAGAVTLRDGPLPCPYDVCPCTVPANRGMIAGIGPG